MNVLFAGTPEFAAVHLGALLGATHEVTAVITQPDQLVGRGRKLAPSPVKRLALAHQIPVIQPQRLTIDDLLPFPADLMIVVAYGQILRTDVLTFPTRGCVNVHASLLPRWRGAAPIARSVLAGDTESGVCLMQMDEGLDTGGVLAQVSTSISPVDTSGSLEARLGELGSRLLVESLNTFDTLVPLPQSSVGMTYATKIKTAEAAIDWDLPSEQVRAHIHGFNPQPGAFSFLGDLRVKFWRSDSLENQHSSAPGTILDINKAGLKVACGSGALLVHSLQLPVGKGRVLKGHEIRNVTHLKAGGRFTRQ